MRPILLLLLTTALASASLAAQGDTPGVRYLLPGRTVPLEKALLKLADQGAPFSYRPDQIPQRALRVPRARRTIDHWLRFLLRDTGLTHREVGGEWVIIPDPTVGISRHSIYGTVTDANTGERLIGATVQTIGGRQGDNTDEFGYYTVKVARGEVRLRASYVGYEPLERIVYLTRDTAVSLQLRPRPDLPEVIVTAVPETGTPEYYTRTGLRIGAAEVERAGGPGGQTDPLRLAQLLPGVTTGPDGIGGLFVRGSDAGHNLVLLDGVPVYNLNHAAGLFSIFNEQAISRLDVYKEGTPARFGDRIGGVIDVHTRDGNLYDHEQSVGANLLATNVLAEGPIKAGEASYLVTARHFWATDLLRRFSRDYKADNDRSGQIDYQVYDLNLRLNTGVGEGGRVYFSFYRGVDGYSNRSLESDTVTILTSNGTAFRYDTPRRRSENVAWDNTIASVRYHHVISDRLFGSIRISYSDMTSGSRFEQSDSTLELISGLAEGAAYSEQFYSGINQLGLAFDGQYRLADDHELRFGLGADFHSFDALMFSGQTTLEEHPAKEIISPAGRMQPQQITAYGSLTGRLGPLFYRAGLRGVNWNNGASYQRLSPRLLLAGPLTSGLDWRLTYDRSYQPVHLISSSTIGLPADLWVPSAETLAPASAQQYAATLTTRERSGWQGEISAYHKRMDGLVEYVQGIGETRGWMDNLSFGSGTAAGVETVLRRTAGKWRGWLSYSYAKSERDFDESVNGGKPYPFRYDRRHNVNLLLVWQLSGKSTLTTSWTYGSGAATSISSTRIFIADPASPDPNAPVSPVRIVREKNGVRFPANHRLDVNFHTEFGSRNGRIVHSLDLGIYNLYNRHNPLYYDTRTDYYARNERLTASNEFVQIFLAPILPSLAYRINFGPKR